MRHPVCSAIANGGAANYDLLFRASELGARSHG
jgi:hypothetical protein